MMTRASVSPRVRTRSRSARIMATTTTLSSLPLVATSPDHNQPSEGLSIARGDDGDGAAEEEEEKKKEEEDVEMTASPLASTVGQVMEMGVGMDMGMGMELEPELELLPLGAPMAMNMGMDMEMHMDMDMAIDADVFRPSALLDAKLEDAFGYHSATTSGVDVEQLLLSHVDTDDDAMSLQLAALERPLDEPRTRKHSLQEAQASMKEGPTARMRGAPMGSGFCPLPITRKQVVLPSHTATAAREQQLSSLQIAAMLPPKYFDEAQTSPRKRRVHRCTFGERTRPFSFQSASSTAGASRMTPSRTQAATAPVVLVSSFPSTSSRRTLFQEEADGAPPPSPPLPPVVARKLPLQLPQHQHQHQHQRQAPLQPQVQQQQPTQSRQLEPAPPTHLRSQGPISAQQALNDVPSNVKMLQTPRSPIPSKCEAVRDDTPESDAVQPPQTPVRASSQPVSSSLTTFTTPQWGKPICGISDELSVDGRQEEPVCQTPQPGTTGLPASISPCFEKAVVVHAKDTPGKVDKFEWTIRTRAASKHESREIIRPQVQKRRVREEDYFDSAHYDHANGGHALGSKQPPMGTGERALPPPYLRGPSSSPQKRRVHSSTFGSFARSFSFALCD